METQPLNESRGNNELRKLGVIIEHVFERGWITEVEKENLDNKEKYEEKKLEIYDLIKDLKDYQNASRLLCAIRCIKEDDTGNEHTDSQSPNQNQQSDQDILISKYLSLLVDHGLTTPEENKLFLSTRTNVTLENSSKSDTLPSPQNNRNPWKISVVIKHLFGFLNVKDIIKYRRVCKEWRDIGNSFMQLRSVVKIYNCVQSPSKFLETFTNDSSLEVIPCFKILGSRYQHEWKDLELANVFDRYQKGIRELELGNLYLITTDGNRVNSQDITTWISRSPMVKETDEYNTKLKIESSPLCFLSGWNGATTIKVPLELLKHIKDISLQYCLIDLKHGIKMAPVNLYLESLTFYQHGSFVPEIIINGIIDFSKIKTINLRVLLQSEYVEVTNITLDLDGEEIVEELTIVSRVKAVNWGSSNWKINKLNMIEIPFVEKTGMEITELVFTGKMSGYDEFNRFDLSALPESIEKLSLNESTKVIHTGRIFLPKLKFLYLVIEDGVSLNTISFFKKCPALVKIIIKTTRFCSQLELQKSWIPRSVKILQLCSNLFIYNNINWQLEPRLCLEKLILDYYDLYEAKIVIANIHADNVVLSLSGSWKSKRELQENNHGELECCCKPRSDGSEFVNFVEHINSIKWCGKLYVGPFTWGISLLPYEHSRIPKYVDKKSEFYVFENGKGKSIDESEFQKAFK